MKKAIVRGATEKGVKQQKENPKRIVASRMSAGWKLLGVTGAAVLLLTACSGGTKAEDDVPQARGTNEEPGKEKPAELVFYSTAGWSEEAFNERFGDAMRKRFPTYTIRYIKSGPGATVPDLLGAGETIDVYWQAVDNTIPQLLQNGLEYDMTELIKKHLSLQDLEPSSIEAAKTMSGGKMYALPLVNNTAALYYNKDVFDKFGVPYLTNNMTWDDVFTVANRMYRMDGSEQYYGINSNFQPHANLSPLSVPYIDPKTEKPTISTDPRWKTIYEHMITMAKTMGGQPHSDTEFVKRKTIAMQEGLANLFLNTDMSSVNWGIVAYPSYKEKPGVGPQPLPTMFGITSISKHKEEAMKVLAYMLSEEAQLSLSERGVIPILQKDNIRSAFASKTAFKDKNLQVILDKPFAPITPKTVYEAKARSLYAAPLVELVKGTVDLNSAFRSIEEQLNKAIAEEKAK